MNLSTRVSRFSFARPAFVFRNIFEVGGTVAATGPAPAPTPNTVQTITVAALDIKYESANQDGDADLDRGVVSAPGSVSSSSTATDPFNTLLIHSDAANDATGFHDSGASEHAITVHGGAKHSTLEGAGGGTAAEH